MQPLRQGDILLIPASCSEARGARLEHLVLAQGEATGHKHRITAGQVDLFEHNAGLLLCIHSETALLCHEEHAPLELPAGNWLILRQREYEPAGWRHVTD